MLPRVSDLTCQRHPQTCRPLRSVFEVARIRLVREDLLQGVRFAVIFVATDTYIRIESSHPTPKPNHQPLLLQGLNIPHLQYPPREKLDFRADLIPPEALLILLLLLLLLLIIRKLVGGRWGERTLMLLPPMM